VKPDGSGPSAQGGDRKISAPAADGDADTVSTHGELERALGAVMAQRVREYRKLMGLSVAQLATLSGLSKGMLSKMENAQASPSLAALARLSAALSVPVTAFFRGLDEEGDVLLVKAGQGIDINHRGSRTGHRYQHLGSMRQPHNRMEPLLVTLVERSEVFPLYQHPGSELLYVIAGTMEYTYGNATYTLEPGDTLQFSGETTHGPRRLVDVPVQFLSVKAHGSPPLSE
jgi:transcriptional regulator with XRE-family HTH domain